MMTDDQILEVVQAHKEGKKIQCRNLGNALNSGWHNVLEPNWNFLYNEFRVAPEPRKPREWLIPIGTKITAYRDGSILHDLPVMVGSLGEYVRVREVIE